MTPDTPTGRIYRQVPAQMTPEEFKDWFSNLYQAITGEPATGTPQEWQDMYTQVRDAFAAARHTVEQ
jgi:hypothetical protein